MVAECGVNYHDLDDALEFVRTAKAIGCDAAKFQLYDEGVIKDSSLRSELSQKMLTQERAHEIFSFGKNIQMPVFFSCMFAESIDWAVELGVPYIKIRELDWRRRKESEQGRVVEKALGAQTPLIISAQPNDLPPGDTRKERYANVKWLLCCPMYPAPLSWFNEDYYEGFDGISNHYPGFGPTLLGVAKGMTMVEAHFTLSHTRGDIDDNVSFDPSQMAELIRSIRDIHHIIFG